MILHSPKNPIVNCPNCSNTAMICEEVDSYESTSDPDIFIKNSLYSQLHCVSCGTVVLKFAKDKDRRKINLRG